MAAICQELAMEAMIFITYNRSAKLEPTPQAADLRGLIQDFYGLWCRQGVTNWAQALERLTLYEGSRIALTTE